jgi:hypothetical protein
MKNETKPKEEISRCPWLLSEDTLMKIDLLMEKAFNDFNSLVKEQNKDQLYLTRVCL